MIATLTSPWALLCLGAYAVCVVLALVANHAAHRKPTPLPDDIRQPEVRDWLCSDGVLRSEAESADWVAAHDDSDAQWLDAWTFGETVPDYVPRSWTA